MVNMTLNGVQIQVDAEFTILEAAKQHGVDIPTLCHLDLSDIKMINKVGTCRVCMVEVEQGPRKWLVPACYTKVWDGLVVNTSTPRAITARRTMVELFLSNHPKDCLVCERNHHCELQTLAANMNVRENKYEGVMNRAKKDTSSQSLIRDPEKCVLCRRCETMCAEVQTVGVYSAVNRGLPTTVGTAFDFPLLETSCTFCGQCVSVCPTAALISKRNITDVWNAINDPDKVVFVQTAPAVRVALGEEFGIPAGTTVTGKMVAALRRLGFDRVYDTNFAADLTIMEEAHELIHRIQNGGTLPMLTSCCPAWVKFIEHQFPDLLDIPSSCKSPHEMFGAIAKTYLAKKLNIPPEKIVLVSIMPCLAKKYESSRAELSTDGLQNVDFVLHTREMASMMREAGINFNHLPDEDFDNVMGESTGAAVIFGRTGGVIEAAVRTAASWLTGETTKKIDFVELRGMDGVREATIEVAGKQLNIGIAHGLGNARKLLEKVRDGSSKYHAIEIMACPGGCVGGGGQPFYGTDRSIVDKRADALNTVDAGKAIRHSHENPEIKALYAEFLEKPGSKKAHDLLHTSYTKREKL